MNTEHKKKDILKNLFRDMPEEQLPDSFRTRMMQQIMLESAKIKKRNERLGLMAVILASLLIVALGVLSFLYMDLSSITIPKLNLTALHFYLFIGALTLFLLFLDYKLRQLFHKDE